MCFQKSTISLIISCVIFFSASVAAQQEQALTGKEYFDVLHKAISEASRSIDIQMYFMIVNPGDPEDPVSVLIADLVRAKHRGVNLRIILEDSKFAENQIAYKMLTREEIEVYFDTSDSLLHSKVVVIDGKTAILGSANWSRAAIYDNHEVSMSYSV
jgi:phosphatidylserine/phosphatidylglycerophosphate/cardiolipin synthase-like enzyme